MRVVIAPSRFAGTLTSREAGEAMASGWGRSAPHDDLVVVPMSDGGPGFLDAVAAALGGEMLAVTVSDAWLRPTPAAVLLTGDGEHTAYLEATQAVGLGDSGHPPDPSNTTSRGLGELLAAALETGSRRIVVGIGGGAGVAVHDGGAGMLAVLGVGDPGVLSRGGAALRDLTPDALDGLTEAVDRFRGVEIVLATRDDLPLLGLQGTSAVEAEARGATPQEAQQLEDALGHWAALLARHGPAQPDLLTGRPRRLDKEPGAGAGGGVGLALLLLGGRRRAGTDLVAELAGLPEQVAAADLAVTGEGTYDWRSLRGSTVAAVSAAGLAAGVPTVVLAGQVTVGRRETMSAGFAGAYAVCERPGQGRLAEVLADPAGTLEDRAARLALTWSPAPGTRT